MLEKLLRAAHGFTLPNCMYVAKQHDAHGLVWEIVASVFLEWILKSFLFWKKIIMQYYATVS